MSSKNSKDKRTNLTGVKMGWIWDLRITETPLTEIVSSILINLIKQFHATGLLLYPLKTSENHKFSYVFRGYRQRPMAWTGLKTIKSNTVKDFEKYRVSRLNVSQYNFSGKIYEIHRKIPAIAAGITLKTYSKKMPLRVSSGKFHEILSIFFDSPSSSLLKTQAMEFIYI